jgi:hypothetical protein
VAEHVIAASLRAQHDHARTKCQLSMRDTALSVVDNEMALKAECIAPPIDHSRSILIAQAGDDGATHLRAGLDLETLIMQRVVPVAGVILPRQLAGRLSRKLREGFYLTKSYWSVLVP